MLSGPLYSKDVMQRKLWYSSYFHVNAPLEDDVQLADGSILNDFNVLNRAPMNETVKVVMEGSIRQLLQLLDNLVGPRLL